MATPRRPEDSLLLSSARTSLAPWTVDAAIATVPRAARTALERELGVRVARNRRLAAELLRLLRLAVRANVAMLPFKGPVLATTVYGDLAMRQFGDQDLLIDAAHSAGAEGFLGSLGYRCRTPLSDAPDVGPDRRAAHALRCRR
jgi:hypothetical protein